MSRSLWLATLAAFAVPPSVSAEDVYSIKLKEQEVIAVERSATYTVDTRTEDAAGKVVAHASKKSTQTYVYRMTTLAAEAGKLPSKVSLQYEKAESAVDDHTTTLPYQGKTVLFEKKDGKYHFEVNGKEPTSEEEMLLLRTSRDALDLPMIDKLFMPARPVALNDVWKIDSDLMSKAVLDGGLGVDSDKAVATGIVRKVYTKDNRLYGVLRCEAEWPLKSIGEGPGKTILDDAKLTYEIDMDGCIDGEVESGTIKCCVKMHYSLITSIGKTTVSVEAHGTINRKELPKR